MIRVILVSAVMALSPAATYAQSAETKLEFDVASIKLTPRDREGRPSFRSNPGRIEFHQTSLAALVQRAYSVPWYQIDWGKTVAPHMPSYDIVATIPSGATTAQQRVMLQSLLTERLKLQIHRESKEMSVYAVVIAKGGLRIHKSPNPSDTDDDPYYLHPGADITPRGWRYRDKMPLSRLIGFLRSEVDRPMVDLTRLDGFYEIDLLYPHEDTPLSGQGMAGIGDPGNMKSLFSAMEKQLGLNVESRKLPLEVLVVDRVDRVPTEN